MHSGILEIIHSRQADDDPEERLGIWCRNWIGERGGFVRVGIIMRDIALGKAAISSFMDIAIDFWFYSSSYSNVPLA